MVPSSGETAALAKLRLSDVVLVFVADDGVDSNRTKKSLTSSRVDIRRKSLSCFFLLEFTGDEVELMFLFEGDDLFGVLLKERLFIFTLFTLNCVTVD